jgi:hypothetical protein
MLKNNLQETCWHDFSRDYLTSIFHLNSEIMKRSVTDNNGYGRTSNERAGDMASKGGPASGLGKADNDHRISTPYSNDLQTQIVAKSKKHKKTKRK